MKQKKLLTDSKSCEKFLHILRFSNLGILSSVYFTAIQIILAVAALPLDPHDA